MNYSKFKTIDFDNMTAEQHNEQLKFLLSFFILYGDESTLKKALMRDETDYTIMLIRDLKMRGLIRWVMQLWEFKN